MNEEFSEMVDITPHGTKYRECVYALIGHNCTDTWRLHPAPFLVPTVAKMKSCHINDCHTLIVEECVEESRIRKMIDEIWDAYKAEKWKSTE
jgi:hypothetical protein